MGTIHFGRTDRPAIDDSLPLTVIATDIAVVPDKDDIATLIAPLTKDIGVPPWQRNGDGRTSNPFINPGTERQQQFALNFVERRARFSVDVDIKAFVILEIGTGMFPIDVLLQHLIALNAFRTVLQDSESLIDEIFADVSDPNVGVSPMVAEDTNTSLIVGSLPDTS